MRASVITASASAASLLAGIGVPIAFPHLEPEVGRYLIFAAALLFVLALGLAWPRTGSQKPTPAQTTSGPHSPNFGDVSGTVTINNHAPAAVQPQKSPYGIGARIVGGEKGRALSRMLEGDDLSFLSGRSTTAESVLRRLREQRETCPPMPIHIALHRIASRIGDKDKENAFPKARQQFRQKALEGRVDVWGQAQIPPTHLSDNRRKGVWSRVDPSHWEDHELHPNSVDKEKQDSPHTTEEEFGRIGGRYWALKVREEEIERRWPNGPTTTNGRKS